MKRKEEGDQTLDIADSLFNLAFVHLIFGSCEISEEVFEESIKIFIFNQNNEKNKQKLGDIYKKLY